MIKVAITDDHPLVLTGIKNMLKGNGAIKLSGAYLSGSDLLEGLCIAQPDILLLDMHLPDIEGEELAIKINKLYPSIRILVLSSIDVVYRVKKMMTIGCAGYLLKNVSKESLIDAILKVYEGCDYLVDPSLKNVFQQYMNNTKAPLPSRRPMVTRREKEILQLLAEGNTSQQIADKLYLSIRTIENHRKSILHKFDVPNTVALLNAAAKLGLIL